MFLSDLQRFFRLNCALETMLNDGIKLLESGNTEEAIFQLGKCIGLAPKSEDFINVRILAIVYLGKAHIKEGRFEEAVRVFHLVPYSMRLNKKIIDCSDVQILLQFGDQHFRDENYQQATLFFNGVRVVAVDLPSVLKAEVGLNIAFYQVFRKSSTWLASKLNVIVHGFLSVPARSNILQEFCEVLFTMGKKKKSKQDYSTSVRDLAAAYELCSHLPTKKSKELYIAINQCFIKVYVKLNDREKALKKFQECMNLEKNFYKHFWKSEECKAKQEFAKYRDKALGRFWMLSILTPALPNDVTFLPVAINMHLTLYKMKRDSNALEDALSCLQNVTSYLEAHGHSDEDFAKEMKSFGNCLSKDKTLEAERVYSFALSAAPKNRVVLRRDLFSNRSLMNQLLGKNEDAIRDARACVELCPQWPKYASLESPCELLASGACCDFFTTSIFNAQIVPYQGYLRLAVAQREQKQFKEAHNALLKCFQFSPVTEQPNLLVHIFKNILAIGTEKERQKFKLPSGISINAINNCLAKLAKEQSPIAFDVIRYIFKESKYADYANAGPVDVVRMMQKDCSPQFIRYLISRGANSSQPLNHLLKSDSRTEEQREILKFLIEQDIDLSRYIKAIPNEPPSFMFVRFCMEYNLLDILSNIVDEKDLSVKDGNGNNILHVLMKMEDSNNVYRCINLVLKRVAVDPKETNKDGLKPSQLSELVSDKRVTLLEEFERDGRSGKRNKKKKKKNNVESPVECTVESTSEIPRNEATSINSLQIADETQKLSAHGPNEDNQLVMKSGPSLPSLYEQSRKTVTDCIRSFKMEAVEKKPESDVIQVIKDEPVPEERPVVDIKLVAGNVPVRKDGEDVDEKPVGENRPANEEKPAAIQSAGSRPSANGNEYSGRDSLLAFGYDDKDQDFETNNDFKQLNVFEGLPWDVQCTSEFWKKLKNPKLAETLKKKLLIKIKLLASGEWRNSLAIKLEGAWCSSGIRLYKCKVTKAARMIWEEAIAFSERRSLDQGKNVQGNSQFVYADVIRLWDFTVDHDEVDTLINRVAESRIRGQSCSFKKKLTKVEVKSVTETGENIRLPNLYKSRNCVEARTAERSKQKSLHNFTFFPSASPNDDEFHILKFYALSSAMAKSVLQNCEQDFDFPFQVSELEYCIIRLNPVPLSSILLLGRSGTGKTTCCVYRLWSKFKTYWENAVTAGPHIPILQRLVNVESEEKEDILKNENDMAASPRKVSRSEERVMSCGCMGVCMCALAAARAANPSIYADEDVESETIETKSSAHPVTEGPSDVGDERSSPSLVEDHENERYRHLRQLFVTKNKVLCHEVSKNFKELCSGLPVSIDHVSFQNEVAIENLNNIHHLSYPLFLGSRDLLLALDATLPGKPFFARDSDGKLLTQVAGWGENESHLAFLPEPDSESEDEDSDVENDDESIAPIKDKRPKSMRQVNSVKREVSYLVFANEVWPLIEKKTVSSYHPSLVWTEFCSFIKGSFASLTSLSGCLTKEQYESIGRKKAPSFTGNRDIIYKMFAKYQRICRDLNLFDEFDFLFNVYKRLSKNPIQPWLFDEIYVDETQDFTEAELFTLIRCCQDPNRLFFTGDTAQSIMRGVAFRFSDLISLFLNAKEALGSVKKYSIQVPDRVHQLTFNYRSHKGILNLASSIVKLLHFFFPESFDHLRDDVGLFDGPKPVILETSDFGDLALMLRGNRRKTSPIEFGAHQVVLVASEASKDKLPEELTHALVLTIYEAKGLEFDDVLLYNFFNDSQAGKEWRVINTYVIPESTKGKESEENGNAKSSGVVSMTESDLALESRPLEFDYNKHKILNSELKQLYTALTRARVNVWIYDEDREKRAPMFSFFKKQGLANTLKLDENQSDSSQENGMFAVKSSITDWEKRGEYFYKKELWSVAYKCFAKTEDKLMLRKCSAHLQAMKSYKMAMDWRESRTGSLKSVYTEYLAATAMYLECGMAEEAVICLRNAKEWKLLGDLLFSLGKYLDAGKYYAKASDSPKDNSTVKASAVKASAVKASECYEVIGDYRSAADILYKREKYQECIQVLKKFETKRSNNNGTVLKPPRSTLGVEKIVKEAADICVKKRDFDNLKVYLKELPLERQLEYLRRKRGCRDIELEVLIENGRGEEAAEIYIQNGEHLKAADCSKEDTTKGICYLEQARSIWNDMGQAISANLQQQKYKQVKQFVDYAVNYLPKDDPNLADCHFLNGLVSEDRSKSLIEAADVYRKNYNNIGVLLCHKLLLEEGKIDSDVIIESLDKMFRQLANIHVSKKAAEVFKLVQQFFGIVKVARDGATFEFRVNKSKIQFHLQILGSPAELEAIKLFDNLDEENGTLDLISALFPYVEDIAAKLFQFYESELERLSFCSQFLQGTSHANCQMMHLIPDGEFAQQRLNLYFSLIQLQGLIRKNITSLVKSKYLESKVNNHPWLSMYNAEMEMVKTCKELYQEIIALYKYLNLSKFTGLQLANSLPDMPFVKEQIQWCLKMMFRGEKKYKDVNIFLETFTMSNFARLNFIQYEVDAISEDIKQRYKETVPIDEPGLHNNREHRFECFHTIFIESWQWLHSEGALIESIHYLLRRALPLLVSPTKHVIMPTLKNCLSLLEFSLTLSLISLCRTSSTNRKRTWIYIPAFYIEGLQFWCGIYESCNKPNYSVWDSIEYVSVQKGRSYVISLVKLLIDFILTTKSGKLDLFSQAFGRTSVESADSQQFLILVLVLLANEELISSIENGYRDVAKLKEGLKSLWRKLMSVTSNAETTEDRVTISLKNAALYSQDNAYKLLNETTGKFGSELMTFNWRMICDQYTPKQRKVGNIASKERRFLQKAEIKPPHFRQEATTMKTSKEHQSNNIAEVNQNLLQNTKVIDAATEQAIFSSNTSDAAVASKPLADDTKASRADRTDDFTVISTAAEHNETKILMREVSYEDQTLEMRDPSAQVKASEERRTRQNDAARKIQSWWKRVRPNHEKAFGGSEELKKTEEHCSKYFEDLKCVPCGNRFSSRKDVDQHILSDDFHERHAADYDKYNSYKQSVYVIWLTKAEDLLDREIQGQKVSTLPNISSNLSERIDQVVMEANLIEKLHQWKELPKLKEYVTALQTCHVELFENIRRSEENDDENYYNDGGYSFRDNDNYDDFEIVTKKRKSKRSTGANHRFHRGGRKFNTH